MLNEAKFMGSVTEVKPSVSGGVTLRVANRTEQHGEAVHTELQLMLRKDCQKKVVLWGIQVGDVVSVKGKLVQGQRDVTLLVLEIHREDTAGLGFCEVNGKQVLLGGVNEVKVRGNLGANPTVRGQQSQFSVAMNPSWSKKASKQKPVWVRVSASGEVSEFARALARGNLTEVHGTMVMENREGGATMQVKATQVRSIPRKSRTEAA